MIQNMEGISLNIPRLHNLLLRLDVMTPDDVLLPKLRLQVGPICSVCMIVGGSILDYAIIEDSMRLNKMQFWFATLLRFVFIPVMFTLTLLYLFLTGHTDPGYVGLKCFRGQQRHVPNEFDEESMSMIENDQANGDGHRISRSNDWGPQAKKLRGSNYYEDLRHSYYDYCERCKVNLPMDRSIGHCDICDACIDGLDHHCPWIGQCIGTKNSKFFIRFNMSWAAMLAQLLLTVLFT